MQEMNTIEQISQLLSYQPCICCGSEAALTGVYIPKEKLGFTPKGKQRILGYKTCEKCANERAVEIENILLKQYYNGLVVGD